MTSLAQAFSPASAKSVKMDGMPGGSVRVCPSEAFAVLSGLPCRPFYFGMAKYAMDDRCRNMLYGLLKRDADKIFKERSWNIRIPGALDSACELAIDMHIYPQISYCRRCQGSGNSSFGVTCKRCSGSGRKSMSNVEIGERLGVSEAAVRKDWNRHLDRLYRIVAGWEQEAANHVRNYGT